MTQSGMARILSESLIVRLADVHEPQRVRWFETHRTLTGSGASGTYARRTRAALAMSPASPVAPARRCSRAATRPTISRTQRLSSVSLIAAGIMTTT